jgi:hypothetical protein
VCVCVCVCEWRGEFNRVVLVVQLGLIFHFILNPEQRRVFQLVFNKTTNTERERAIGCELSTKHHSATLWRYCGKSAFY